MHFINPGRHLLLAAIFAFAFSACRTVQTGDVANVSPPEVQKTESIFSNKEPDKYQTEIWQSTPAGTEKFFAVRSGDKWRIDSAYGDPKQVTSLHTDKDYVFSYETRIYAEYPVGHGFDEREGMIDEISLGMLNSKAKGTFEVLGRLGSITKYKVVSDADKGKESVVSFDEKLRVPVRKEIYSKITAGVPPDVIVTLEGFKTDVDDSMFAPPKGFKKVSVEDMKKALSGIN